MRATAASSRGLANEVYTLSGYGALLETALDAGYAFVGFHEAHEERSEPRCLLRHDVDVDVAAAAELAHKEADYGVRATYFVMVRSAFYNVFSRWNHVLLQEILSLGHWLGLHYDVAFLPDEGSSHETWIELEAELLGRMFGVDVTSVSFHQPAYARDVAAITPNGLVSAYRYPGYHYVSDANKSAELAGIHESFRRRRHSRLQLLVHPIWWTADDASLTTEELFDRAMLANLRRAGEQIRATERAFGRPRTFRIELDQPDG